ncbi:MAG: peptidylprolyl isomerase, partial [Ignavibacteria bacterium]|nr:peptidylprolyl isomerase [Ignavibacteria bacterium]
GPGYEIITELSPIHFSKGILGMARSDFDTEGSQWFVTTGDFFHLDGNYTVFGKVVSGQNIIDSVEEGDLIINVTKLSN